MKLLVTSDWHADWRTLGHARFDEVEESAMKAVYVADGLKVDLMAFAGDLCDPDIGPDAIRSVWLMARVAVLAQKREVPFVLIPGNHDVIEDGSGKTTLTPLRALEGPICRVVERPGVVQLAKGPPVMCLPFTATSHAYDPVLEVAAHLAQHPLRREAVVLGHLHVPDVIPGEETTDMPRGREVTFPIAEVAAIGPRAMINGHYHRAQRSPGGVWIPGSLARLTFGEEKHEPSMLVLEW